MTRNDAARAKEGKDFKQQGRVALPVPVPGGPEGVHAPGGPILWEAEGEFWNFCFGRHLNYFKVNFKSMSELIVVHRKFLWSQLKNRTSPGMRHPCFCFLTA